MAEAAAQHVAVATARGAARLGAVVAVHAQGRAGKAMAAVVA